MLKPTVTISSKGNRGTVDPRTVKRRAERILAALGKRGAELSIVLCDDSFIKALNREYRDKDEPTDVLSFSMNEGDVQNPHPQLLGDVIISVETAVRQATRARWKPMDEITSLLIHGVLHLLGHDHKEKSAEEKMTAQAKRLESMFSTATEQK